MNIPLSSPDISQLEIDAVVGVLKTPQLSLGPKLDEFEEKFAHYIGTKHAIAVNSGTSALHLCVRSCGIQEGDEVITTPFSFISSANCILFEKAKPVFVDIRPDTLNIDEDKIEEKITSRTKAILPVHVFGYPCDMEKILKIARKYQLKVIEDACEAIGASIEGKKVGQFSDCAVFAFYPNKQMTTGEGGMVVTNDDEIARLCRSMRNQGRGEGEEWLLHSRLGYNYRLSDINCVLGIAQLERIEELLAKRDTAAELYAEHFSGLEDIILPTPNIDQVKRSWFVYVIRLSDRFSARQRDQAIDSLRQNDMGCNSYFPPIHLQTHFREMFGYKKGDFPLTEQVSERTIALPFFGKISSEQVHLVANVLKRFIKEVR